MDTIKVHVAGNNFIPSSRNFAKSNPAIDMWRNQDGTAPTEADNSTKGFWNTQSSDLLDTITTLGQTVITTKGQIDIAKAGGVKNTGGTSSGSGDFGGTGNFGSSGSGAGSHKTLYTVLTVVGIAALAGGVVMYMRKRKK